MYRDTLYFEEVLQENARYHNVLWARNQSQWIIEAP